jgi:5-methylcytosine-specific restriction endonuclease McrA
MCEETRQCGICNEVKPLEKFEIDSRKKDKRTNRCYDCKYEQDDKASRAFRSLKSRSLKLGIPMEVTAKEIRLLFEMFQGTCAYCGKRPEKEHQLHLEHIVALSEGGRNTLANLLPADAGCNISKSNKPLVTHFLNNRERFPDGNLAQVIDYMALLQGVSKEDVAKEMTDDHVAYLLKQARQVIEKEAK